MVICHWSLVIGHWSLVIGHWSFVICHLSLVLSDLYCPSTTQFDCGSIERSRDAHRKLTKRVVEVSRSIGHLSLVEILSLFTFRNIL
ncbi:hypothetical protein LC605_03845 [Nostoc sp. CHAB 5836]|uniref:hypothetical protein n=1 Tax=Nostoc sp. CHAB 5836 TaxID=2780404 RepID=UPI001E595E55|nr:hypothetical protein [Nostoc sp. CHAB 5836]MCC5614221.1 hypothetical protein [Nostoc sp. CHAB 5836]